MGKASLSPYTLRKIDVCVNVNGTNPYGGARRY
jgi:hypothetical protein